MLRHLLCAAALVVAVSGIVRADARVPNVAAPSDTLYTISLIDGSRINGHIIERGRELITIETPAGVEMTIRRSSIESIRAVRGRQTNGGVRRYDPNSGRLVYTPTGRPREAGEFIFADHMLFMPSLTYGLTDNVGLLAGMSIVPGIGLSDQILYAAPQVGYSFNHIAAASAGAMFVHVGGENVGVMFATGTLGSPDKSLTIGYGVPFALGGDISTVGVLIAGGELQLSNSVALISENWFAIDGADELGHLFSAGVRLFGDNISVDLVGLYNEEFGASFPIPWVSFSYTWDN